MTDAPKPRASLARYRAALRRALQRNARPPEVDFLNITAMLDLMTIILVFLLKSMSATAAALPPTPDLTVPTSIARWDKPEDGVVVIVSRSQILVGENSSPVVQLADREQLAVSGLPARYKRNGPNDLYIVPLGQALTQARETDRAVRGKQDRDTTTSEAMLVVDRSTPYRLLVEVLFTLGQAEFGKYHLVVMGRGTRD